MKNTIFGTKLYQYPCLDWNKQKKVIQSWVEKTEFKTGKDQPFYSDRVNGEQFYQQEFVDTFKEELTVFKTELSVNFIEITTVWLVKYEKGDWHPPHTHGSKGYSGVIYVEYDENEHTPTYFINSTTDPVTDRTNYVRPNMFEGDIVIAPSNILHFTYPNTSDKARMILGFDMNIGQPVPFGSPNPNGTISFT